MMFGFRNESNVSDFRSKHVAFTEGGAYAITVVTQLPCGVHLLELRHRAPRVCDGFESIRNAAQRMAIESETHDCDFELLPLRFIRERGIVLQHDLGLWALEHLTFDRGCTAFSDSAAAPLDAFLEALPVAVNDVVQSQRDDEDGLPIGVALGELLKHKHLLEHFYRISRTIGKPDTDQLPTETRVQPNAFTTQQRFDRRRAQSHHGECATAPC